MLFHLNDKQFIDTSKGKDISIALTNDEQNPRAWYVDPPVFEPVRANGFIGSVAEGGGVNFRNIFFNPHGHGTHTECLGHITEEVYSINQHLKSYFFTAKVVSVEAEKRGEDLVVTKNSFPALEGNFEAIIIRTLPNSESKKHLNYSATNPPYLDLDVIELLEKHQVKHLLLDLPSVDREEDGGVLAFHHAFWKVPENPQFDKTITELIYVSDEIKDGDYILNLQTAPFENDASPSRPVLFEIFEK
ncbi:MAG: cyclase family protein [Flavobacteriia bacterium]|jgi:arylformamidase